MAETPVSVVKSGKTYRQLFDAEVQLMKSLGSNRTKLNSAKVLPAIRSNSGREGTGLTAQSILTNRQSHWKDGPSNDYYIENPVDYMQKEAEMELKRIERRKRKEENEVRGLPEVVSYDAEESEGENIIEKIEASCRERYDSYLVEMYEEIRQVRLTINPQVAQIGINLSQSMDKVDAQINDIFDDLSLDENIFGKSTSDLDKIWAQIEKLFTSQTKTINKYHLKFNNLEDQRLTLITKVLHKYADILKAIAAIPVSETRRLMEKESMLLNQTSLANRRAFGELKRNLHEKMIKSEMEGRRQYEQRVSDSKLMARDHIIKTFKDYMKLDEVKNPAEVTSLHEEFMEEQRQLVSVRTSVLNQLIAFQPPVSTKPSVYKWNSTLTKTQQKIENLHKKWIEDLQMTYENICQQCLEKVDQAKEELAGVTDESVMIVNEEFLTRVGNQLKIFESKIHKMEGDFEQSSRHNEKELRRLFKFVQSTAHLWDVHEINMARKDKEVETELEQGRLVYDKTNEERESRLDVLLDRLRQENSVESLRSCQNVCFHLLSEIKHSYHEFCDEQSEQMEVLLPMVEDEVDRYEQAVCKFFNVTKQKPKKRCRPKKQQQKQDADADPAAAEPHEEDDDVITEGESNDNISKEQMEEVVELVLRTNGGVTYLLTSDDVIDKENDSDQEVGGDDDDDGDDVTKYDRADSPSPAAAYMEDVAISSQILQELKKKIRFSFLQHLDTLRTKCVEVAEEKVSYKKEELKCELELRLHLHVPRSQRIQKDIRNVREVELTQHTDRIDRHCKGVTSTLGVLRTRQNNFVEYENQEIGKLKEEVVKIEHEIAKLNISARIEKKIEDVDSMVERFIEMLRTEGKRLKGHIMEKFGTLKQSNRLCIESFRLFADGGSFSPDEAAVLRKQVDVSVDKVNILETTIKNEFDKGIESKCEVVRELRRQFNERMKFHLADVKFMELVQSWFLSAQVGIKSEVAYNNRMAAQLNDNITLLIDRIDACEYSHVDKEVIDEEKLLKFCEEVIHLIKCRSKYLNCRLSDLLDNAATVQTITNEEDSKEAKPSANEGESSSKESNKVISVIRNIFKKQNAAGEESVPSSGEVPVRKVYRENKSDRKGGGGAVVRETKLDARFFPFGNEIPRKAHFIAKISCVLFKALENLYIICDDYYKHKSFRATTRPRYIQDSYEACCESVLEKILKFYDQCQAHYDLSLSDFRTVLERSEYILQNVPRIWINKMGEKFEENFNQKLDEIEDNYRTTHGLYQQEKNENETQLEPSLGHPQMREKFNTLEGKEKARKERHKKLIEETFKDSNKVIKKSSNEFTKMVATECIELLRKFQLLLCVDDVTIPDTTPEVKFSMDTLLKKRCKCGLELEQLRDPNCNASVVDLERGVTLWPGLKIPPEMIKRCSMLKQFQEPIETSNAVKPQQQIIKSRDQVYDHFLQSRVNALKRVERKRDERAKTEARWDENWTKSMQNIYHFYN